MIPISYTITPSITDHLTAIDAFRRNILTTPLSPTHERKHKWNATINHLYASHSLADISISKSQIIDILTHIPKRPTSEESLVQTCKYSLDWISETWTASPKQISFGVLETMSSMIVPTQKMIHVLQDEETNAKHLFSYLQSQSDHPILMAAIVQGALATSELHTMSHGIISRYMTALVLAKYGYDCRGLLTLDPIWKDTRERYDKAIDSIVTLGHLTAWLEYFVAVAEDAYEALASSVTKSSEGVLSDLPASSWQLTHREELIIHRLESPTSHITNRDVQRAFHVSQVTASRDLTRLTSLGLLYTHGKGRSIYYTKA